MRIPPLRPSDARNRRGVALIIVLAFVVLLTGVVVAFFSRSLSERQISNSSAGQVKVDLFAQGAVATITDDLKQEIAAGSNATYYSYTDSTTQVTTVYPVLQPLNPTAAAPAVALKGQQGNVTTFAPNLVKRSAYGQNFFPDGNDVGATNYNVGNTTATVVLPAPVGATPSPVAVANRRNAPNRAANVSTTTASSNGRSISTARWNKPLLLPKSATVLSDPTKSDPAPTLFAAPDWILVARDGTNPGSPNFTPVYGANQSGTVSNPAVANPTPTNPGYVTGRYAYTIYDEGGLLDANVAGYPTDAAAYPTGPDGSTIPSLAPPYPTGKTGLAYADLTIPLGGQAHMLTGAQVNSLVGWRNYASSQALGAFPTFTPRPTPTSSLAPKLSPFDQANLYNTNGFLGVGTSTYYQLYGSTKQSDRTFGTRQELINFFTQVLPTVDTSNPAANLQNSLQYFGNFSRGLNQPSYTPVSRVASTTNQNPRPLIQPSTATGSQPGGGNNVGDFYTTGADQDTFSPSFLNVRVQTNVPANQVNIPPLGRSDGTNLIGGEPLVKGRFPLQRLAWLTYRGPSAARLMTDPDMQALQNTYGITQAYLLKGTAANIQNYFGLKWDSLNHRWQYNYHNGGTASGVGPGSGAIMKLQTIADQKQREPDFFELLKATVDVGALGKAATNAPRAEPGDPTTSNGIFVPLNVDFARDISVDASIIQLGANIIDQFDLDGYPTRIEFTEVAGSPREFRGVENLPYIYRIRYGTLKVRESIPSSVRPPGGSGAWDTPYQHSGPAQQPTYANNPLKDAGVGILMAVPDVWNPHDQNSFLNLAGQPRPGDPSGLSPTIRVVANSARPDDIYAGAATGSTAGYSNYLAGGFAGTTTGYRGNSFDTGNPTPTVTPAAPAPGSTPVPFPFFTRGANPNGTLVTPTLLVGNTGLYTTPHIINVPSNVATPASLPNTTYLTFQIPNEKVFREPAMLAIADPAGSTKLSMYVDALTNLDIINLQNSSGARVYSNVNPTYGIKSLTPFQPNPLLMPSAPAATMGYIGIELGLFPLRYVGPRWPNGPLNTYWNYTDAWMSDTGTPVSAICYSLQYQDPQNTSSWVTYDEKYVDTDLSFVHTFDGYLNQPGGGAYSFADPRTARFGSPTENNIADAAHYRAPLVNGNSPSWANTWLDTSGRLISVVTERPDITSGFGSNFRGVNDWGIYPAKGLHSQNIDQAGGTTAIFLQTGMFAQNDPNYASSAAGFGSDGFRLMGDTPGVLPRDSTFWSDPDGVVRRGMGAYVLKNSTVGQPLATATTISNGVGTPKSSGESQNRPIILNRPFRTVGELGYVFSGNPWKNVDFSTPESGYSALLDVFCVNDTAPLDGLVAGKVDLNTRQPAVLKSILTGAYTDEENTITGVTTPTPLKPLTAIDADTIAGLLVKRTTVASPSNSTYVGNFPQPLQNVGDLVGRWNSKQTISGSFTPALGSVHNIDGSKSYDGFSADLAKTGTGSLASVSTETLKIPRMRESAIRALSNVGNTRVWNLMIDVIAQSGRFPPAANTLNNFVVEGEQRYWVHLAIDRYTGTILDTKFELVKE